MKGAWNFPKLQSPFREGKVGIFPSPKVSIEGHNEGKMKKYEG